MLRFYTFATEWRTVCRGKMETRFCRSAGERSPGALNSYGSNGNGEK